MRRLALAVAVALTASTLSISATLAHGRPAPAFEFLDCAAQPPFLTTEPAQFLPIFLPGEDEGFVDLGSTLRHARHAWGALQFSRDCRARLLTSDWCSWKWPMRWRNRNVAGGCATLSSICAAPRPATILKHALRKYLSERPILQSI